MVEKATNEGMSSELPNILPIDYELVMLGMLIMAFIIYTMIVILFCYFYFIYIW